MTVQQFNLTLPSDLTGDQLAEFIGLVAQAAAAKRTAVIFGTTATKTAHAAWIEVEQRLQPQVLSLLQTCLPGVRVETADTNDAVFTLVGDVRLSTTKRPLNAAAQVASGLQATARSLYKGEQLQWQLMITGARTPRPIHNQVSSDPGPSPLVIALGFGGDPMVSDSRDRSDLITKHKRPLINALGTLAVRTAAAPRDKAVVGQALSALRSIEAPGVTVSFRKGWQGRRQRKLDRRQLPAFEWPLQLNLDEAAAMLGWPTEGFDSAAERSRWMSSTGASDRRGVAVAETRDEFGKTSDLVVPDAGRNRHLHVLGPTGTGKSTVLARAALQDIDRGRAVVVLDPKRDLVQAILQRIPYDHIDRVLVFDPSSRGQILAMNPLRSGPPEQATDFLVHLMRGLFARAWGPRTEDVLRTGLLTLALSGKHTLVDLPRLLTDEHFRSGVQASLPAHPLLTEYWTWFEALSDAHRAEITAPLLSRLRSLLLAGPLHRILSVPEPRFDLDIAFRNRQVVLVPLSAGQLGEDAAGLLGSLVMARIWQLTQERSRLPDHARHPVMLYLDEFHQYLHLPTSMSEALAQARGLGVSLTLAHQHLDQLTSDVRAAVLANARNRIVFQLPAKDAGVMASDMAPLVADDFKNLSSYEIYLRTVAGSAVQRPVSGYTKPLRPGDSSRAAAIHKASIERYGDAPITPVATTSTKPTEPKKSPLIGFAPTEDGEPGEAA